MLSRAYDDARRAVTYLRWHEDDADEIAPSLYAGRGGRRPRSDEAEAAAAPSSSGPTPSTAPSGTPPTIVIDNSAGLPIDAPLTN